MNVDLLWVSRPCCLEPSACFALPSIMTSQLGSGVGRGATRGGLRRPERKLPEAIWRIRACLVETRLGLPAAVAARRRCDKACCSQKGLARGASAGVQLSFGPF